MTRPDQPIRDARELAAELLARTRSTGPFISDLFDELAESAELEPRDRHLALELAAGVVRHRRTLDCVLDAFARRPLVKSPPLLRVLVRLGAYQLLFLDRIPDHAAVDQTVELAKQWARSRIKKHPASIASFVNGLLRGVASGRQAVPGTTVPGTTVPGTTVPGTAVPGLRERRGRKGFSPDARRRIERPTCATPVVIDRDVFADPRESPGEYLADAYSFDPWLAGRWVERFGLDKACEIARAQNRRASLTLRVNLLRTTTEAVAGMLQGEGVTTKPVRLGLPLLRVVQGDPLHGKTMQLGLIQPQDPWAASVVPKMGLAAGMTVLDRCAAPGTKTMQMVELMRDNGSIIAVDQDEEGLQRVTTNIRRMGGHIVQAILAEEMPAKLLELPRIDRVLADVPCSNSGVLARRPEARWRIDAESTARLVRTQRELLMDALNWVSPGGKVVYSTCSIEPEENELVVQYAVNRRHGEVRVLDEQHTLPSLRDDHDGGYWALLARVR